MTEQSTPTRHTRRFSTKIAVTGALPAVPLAALAADHTEPDHQRWVRSL